MKLNFELRTIVNVPADEAWRILAHEFSEVDKWSAGISSSSKATQFDIPTGASVGGRTCRADGSVMGVTEVLEEFVFYDEDGKCFEYLAAGMPSFIKEARNRWHVESIDEQSCHVGFRAQLTANWLVAMLFRFAGEKLGRESLEEFKHYAQTGEAHPRKTAAVVRAAAGEVRQKV